MTKGSSVGEGRVAAQPNGIKNDGLIRGEPQLHRGSPHMRKVMFQVRNKPAAGFRAYIWPAIMQGTNLLVEMTAQYRSLGLRMDAIQSIFVQFPQEENLVPDDNHE
jgi:hypothetical protein